MRAYLLKFNMMNGESTLETHRDKTVLLDTYNGHPQGIQITNQTELAGAKKRFAGNGWAQELLNDIDTDTLED